LINMNERPNS